MAKTKVMFISYGYSYGIHDFLEYYMDGINEDIF